MSMNYEDHQVRRQRLDESCYGSWKVGTVPPRQAVRPSTPGIAGQGPCEDRPAGDWDP